MSETPPPLSGELALAKRLAREASAVVMGYFRGDALNVELKDGELGPVTAADRAANALIVRGIQAAYPDDLVVAEESPHPDGRATRTWYVDPIDGTRDFIQGRPDFAVMIGLVIEGAPHLGVVVNPPSGALSWAVRGAGAWREMPDGERIRLKVSARHLGETLRAVRSRSHPSEAVNRLCAVMGIEDARSMGSLGLKVLELATGHAELYANLSGFSAQWDIAGPQVILEEAGGRVTTAHGTALVYEAEHLYLTDGVIATNGLVHQGVLDEVERLGLAA